MLIESEIIIDQAILRIPILIEQAFRNPLRENLWIEEILNSLQKKIARGNMKTTRQ